MPIRLVEQFAGLGLLTLILIDIFVTVLYARAGSEKSGYRCDGSAASPPPSRD